MKSILMGFSVAMALLVAPDWTGAQTLKDMLYDPGVLKPIDSTLKVKVGQAAPDFTLPAISGEKIRLSQYRGQKERGDLFCARGLYAGVLGPVAGLQHGARPVRTA